MVASLVLFVVVGHGSAQAQGNPQSLGSIRPTNLQLPALGYFAVGERAMDVARAVSGNLDLGDIATKPASEGSLASAQSAEAASGGGGEPQYGAWATAGTANLLRVRENDNAFDADLYDIVGKQRLVGRKYTGANTMEIAHKISDDCMTALTNQPGIFSSRVAFVQGSKSLVAMFSDGSDKRTIASDSNMLTTPAWGDAGQELFFTGYASNNPDLYCVSLGGSKRTVSTVSGLNTSPNWCQSAGRVALTMSKDGNSEIYSMTKSGFLAKRLTNDPGADTAPAWKPDGSQIAFTSDRGGSPQIYVMSSSGGSPQRISIGSYCDSPAWSPDGNRLAYVVREGGEFNIYMANLASGELTQLTRGAGKNEDPSWGPSSNHIVFSSTKGGGPKIYMMNVNTKTMKDIGSGSGTQPVWGPKYN